MGQRATASSLRGRSAHTLALVPTDGRGWESVHSWAPQWTYSPGLRSSFQAGPACAHVMMHTLSSDRETLTNLARQRGGDARPSHQPRSKSVAGWLPMIVLKSALERPGVARKPVFPASRVGSGRPRHRLKTPGCASEPPLLPNPTTTLVTTHVPHTLQKGKHYEEEDSS